MAKKTIATYTGIKVDMKIMIEIEEKNGVNGITETLSLSSSVEEIMNDGCLLIHMPISHGHYRLLPADTPVLMYFFTKQRMFSLTVKFLENIKRDGLLYAKVKQIGAARPNQRRSCYRLECSLPVTVGRARVNGNERQTVEGMMINLSDGGMLFAVNEEVAVGEEVTLSFNLDAIETVEAEVIRSERLNNGTYKRKAAVRFILKNKAQKARFFKYIMERQREKMRRQAEEKYS